MKKCYLRPVLDEVEEEHVLPPVPHGRVQGPAGLLLEHGVEQGARHVTEVLAGEVILPNNTVSTMAFGMKKTSKNFRKSFRDTTQ